MTTKKTHVSKPIRESDRREIVRRLEADIPRALALLTPERIANLPIVEDFNSQFDELMGGVTELINAPKGVDLATHVRTLIAEPFTRFQQGSATLEETVEETFSPQGMANLMLIGARPDVNAANAWELFQAAKRQTNVNAALQLMSIGAFFYGRACAAAIDRSAESRQRSGGLAKQHKDPVAKGKADAKVLAYQLWLERRAGKHPKLRTTEQFALEVMRRWPVLTSAKVICGWSALWGREARVAESR